MRVARVVGPAEKTISYTKPLHRRIRQRERMMPLQIEKTTMALALLISALLMSVASVCVDESAIRRTMVRVVASLATPSNDLQSGRSDSGVVSARVADANRPLQRASVPRARILRRTTLQTRSESGVCSLESARLETSLRPSV